MKKLFFAICILMTAVAAHAALPPLLSRGRTAAGQRWVDSVMATLTPRDRAAQLVFTTVDARNVTEAQPVLKRRLGDLGCGGILFSQGSLDNHARLNDYSQSVANVPVLVTFDGEWGLSMRIPQAPRFPKNMALGAIADPALLYDYGREMARECRRLGVQVNFAPVVDVNSNPANPVIGTRSFGSDPARVAALATAYARGLEDGGVQAVAKHFPGHGDTNTDSHKTRTVVKHDRNTLQAVDLLPFAQMIDSGISGMMVGHIVVPALDPKNIPASASHKITSDLLRDQMHFSGLTYTDAMGMKGSFNQGRGNAVESFLAGADVLLGSDNPSRDINALTAAVKSGRISQDEIDRRCRRLLEYKYALGLDTVASASTPGLAADINSAAAEAVNRRLSAASITALHNRNGLLPLSVDDRSTMAIVVIGNDSDGDFSDICRRYRRADFYHIANGQTISAAQLKSIAAHDVVAVAVLDRHDQAAVTALRQLADHCPNLAVALVMSPYQMSRFAEACAKAGAVVAAFDDTPYLRQYAAQALFGGIDLSGTAPVDIKGVAKCGQGERIARSRLGYGTPLMTGMDAGLQQRVDSIINRGIADGAFPGAQLLVAKDGMVVIDKSYGRLTKGGAMVADSTLYDLASVSKTVGTLPGTMVIYDRGLVELDRPASTYVPGLRVEGKDSITIRDLLYHETGMQPSLSMFEAMIDTSSYSGKLIVGKEDKLHPILIQKGAWGHRDARLRTDILADHASDRFPIESAKGIYVGRETYDSIMNRIYASKLRPNRNYTYSCLNFCLLMDVEQHVTGQPHDSYVADNVWRPIGAYNFTYRPMAQNRNYSIAPTELDRFLRRQTLQGYVHDELASFSGGVQGNAGVFGTAEDIAKLCQMWLQGGTYGNERIISDQTARLFTTEKSPNSRRGLGFDKPDKVNPDWSPTCEEAPASVYGHTGFTGTIFWVDPEQDLIFVFLNNRVNPTRDNPVFSRANIRPELFRQVLNAVKK